MTNEKIEALDEHGQAKYAAELMTEQLAKFRELGLTPEASAIAALSVAIREMQLVCGESGAVTWMKRTADAMSIDPQVPIESLH